MVPEASPAPISPMMIANLPVTRWLFALRIWGAVLLALGLAFWLQLDTASSAGVCVAILAQQTRGQALEKAGYRMLGTVVGGIVAIVLTDAFAQARDLYVLAYSAWLALCVFAAGFLDGNRAYGAVLCGYTVSVVTIEQIDSPDHVFDTAINRVVAILVGIAAIALVNDLLGASDVAPALLSQVEAARNQVRGFATRVACRGCQAEIDEEAGKLLRTISDWHPTVSALPTETLAGSHRAAAVRAVGAALIGEIFAARGVAELLAHPEDNPLLSRRMLQRQSDDLQAFQDLESATTQALRAGRRPVTPPRWAAYHSWQNALRNAVRAFIISAVAGIGFILTGWPQTAFGWGVAGILIGLSATAPEPRVPALNILLALPVSAVLGGVTIFVFLDGSDAFPLLGLGLSLPVVAGALLLASPNPRFAGIGAFMTVFTLIIVGAANPQDYDPLNYCIRGMLLSLAAIIVYIGVNTLFPAEDSDRRAWVLDAARRAARSALQGRRHSDVEDRFLDASRIATLSTLKDVPPARQAADLAALFWLAELSARAQRVWVGLDRLSRRTNASVDRAFLASLRATVRVGLQHPNGGLIRHAAAALVAHPNADAQIVGAELALAAHLIDQAPTNEARQVFAS